MPELVPGAERRLDIVTTGGSAPHSRPEALRSQGDGNTALLQFQEGDKDEDRTSDSKQSAQAIEKALQIRQPRYPLHGATTFYYLPKEDSPSFICRHLTQSAHILESRRCSRIFI